MPATDAELVNSACAGERDSFRLLYERHYRMAVGLARGHIWDQHLAEDAAQEAFAVACRQLHKLKDPQRFRQWLGTICRRTAIKLARAHQHESAIEHEPEAAVEAVAEDENAGRVREAMERLSPAAREVVQLHYFSGLSYQEIADSLGLTTQAVHGRLQRARRMLADWLAKAVD